MGSRRRFDPGVQNERTALAWTRTGLSLLGGSLLVARLSVTQLGAAAVLVVVCCVPLSCWILATSHRRYRAAAEALHAQTRLPDGALPAAVSALTVILGGSALVHVLVRL